MSDNNQIGLENLEQNQYRAECQTCGDIRIARVDGANTITTDELEEIQELRCRHCDDDTPHSVLEAGGDSDRQYASPDNPKQCPNCGSAETVEQRYHLYTEPPELSLYRDCLECEATFNYSFRGTPTLELVRGVDR